MNPYFARLLSTFFKGFSEWNSTFHFTKQLIGESNPCFRRERAAS